MTFVPEVSTDFNPAERAHERLKAWRVRPLSGSRVRSRNDDDDDYRFRATASSCNGGLGQSVGGAGGLKLQEAATGWKARDNLSANAAGPLD